MLDLYSRFCLGNKRDEERLARAEALQEPNKIIIKHVEVSSIVFTMNPMEAADSDSMSSTQESCVPDGEDVEPILTGEKEDTISDSASGGNKSILSECEMVMVGNRDDPYL